MQFENVSKALLKELLSKGYNILTSNNMLSSDIVYWYPEKVEDVQQYIETNANEEPTLLVIQDALENIREQDLVGLVFVS
ncbi:hypothetical protein [Sphingobacterium yanglingense]|uniref:Uncharacterized protein n=1 Tax=Sphingobacterium yanglingense TaxID=1437280 RepID=A0A4R6WLI2_9SPHI|nr:hypothetical protein [Sphingobacterium yanglingense]TDQ79602.1 hypothetical protein CLV99_1047 [Sphingobacterium yanglingense]